VSFSQTSLKPTTVNIFKNGTYYIVKEGNIKTNDGSALIEIPSNPLLGTYWITSVKDLKISDINYKTDTLKTNKRVQSIIDLIGANIGKKLKFTYKPNDKELRDVSGILVSYQKLYGLIKLKQADNKYFFLYVNNIVDVLFEENPEESIKSDSVCRLAQIKFDKTPSSVDLKVYYMQNGMQWLPSYNVKLINDKELQLEMKAIVENYAETVENAELTLTVGSPQFYFGSAFDPISFNDLTNGYSLKTTSSAFRAAQPMQQYYSNAIMTDGSLAESAPVAYDDYNNYDTQGEKTNDLYIYKLGKVSLPNKSKTSFQIFSVKIGYKDVYEVNLNDFVSYYNRGYISIDPDKRYDVYHSFQLLNTTSFPFTTAPVFVLNEQLQPLAQDQIKYTPSGSNCTVQLSKAGDVIIKNKEEEIKKEDGVKRVGKSVYNRVTIKGTVTVENLQDKKINLNIDKNLIASIIEVSDKGKIIKSGRYSNLNPNSSIEWEIQLIGKEKKEITYQYEVLVNASLGSY